MRKTDGTIQDTAYPLFHKKQHVICPYCGVNLDPTLMSIADHWFVCLKNPKAVKTIRKNLLIDELTKIITF